MSIWILDAEADGLLDEATKIHCVCAKELYNDNWVICDKGTGWIEYLVEEKGMETLVGHNLIGYDLPIFDKLVERFSFHIGKDCFNGADVEIVDTLVLSRTLYPDRPLPQGCPEYIHNPVTKKKELVGPHGLMAHAYRLGGSKPIIHDWRDQPVEVYIDRCKEDVLTTELLLLDFMKEVGIQL